jgi:AraC-like DNA-binding protein
MSKRFRVSSQLAGKLKELGVQPSDVLQSAGLPAGFFEQTKIQATTEELFALWRAIGECSQDPAIGLKLGTENSMERYDAIHIAAVCSRNFGEALRQIARYKQLTCPEEILIEQKPEEWGVQFRWLLATEPEPDVLVDLCFAWMLSVARRGTGSHLSPIRIELVQPRPKAHLLEHHFGCPVFFGADRNALIFSAADVERPFSTHNAELLSMLGPQLDEELNRNRVEQTFPEQVRAVIQRRLAGQRPKIQDVARELHISSRTLQRRLQENGYSFQQVLEESRRELARHYLTYSPLELTETAYLLGYEDANSFVRAFRGWEGVPPAHWRESQRIKAIPVAETVNYG